MRGALVTGVQTCALPISRPTATRTFNRWSLRRIPQRLASGLPAFRQAVAIRLSAVAWCGSWSPIIHARSEEHTSELQSLMRISYAVFCLKKKNTVTQKSYIHESQHQAATHSVKLTNTS